MFAPLLTHRYQLRMQAMRRHWEPPMARDLAAYLRGALRRTLEMLPKSVTIIPAPAPSEAAILRRTLGPWYQRALSRLQDTAKGMDIAGELHDVAVQQYLGQAGRNIVGITETTRKATQEALQAAYTAHETYPTIVSRLTALPVYSAARARIIAQTELGQASNQAALYVYRASPVVDGVLVYDGIGDNICAEVAGRRVTLDEAESIPLLGHVACRRSMAPLVGYREGA